MKYLLLIWLGLGCAVVKEKSSEVLMQEDQILKTTERYSHSYSIKDSPCKLFWEVNGNKKSKGYWLRLRYGYPSNCGNFATQKSSHTKILKVIFQKHSSKHLKSVSTPGFERVQPDLSWNIAVAKAAAQNTDWLDYTKRYPRHRSKKSSNQIFLEVVNRIQVYRPLSDLFYPYDIQLHLKHVEKVFAQKLVKLPFARFLQGVRFKNRLMYDAGMMDYSISDAN
jgi:hypothetical protein